jgi:hypothetical protein
MQGCRDAGMQGKHAGITEVVVPNSAYRAKVQIMCSNTNMLSKTLHTVNRKMDDKKMETWRQDISPDQQALSLTAAVPWIKLQC